MSSLKLRGALSRYPVSNWCLRVRYEALAREPDNLKVEKDCLIWLTSGRKFYSKFGFCTRWQPSQGRFARTLIISYHLTYHHEISNLFTLWSCTQDDLQRIGPWTSLNHQKLHWFTYCTCCMCSEDRCEREMEQLAVQNYSAFIGSAEVTQGVKQVWAVAVGLGRGGAGIARLAAWYSWRPPTPRFKITFWF